VYYSVPSLYFRLDFGALGSVLLVAVSRATVPRPLSNTEDRDCTGLRLAFTYYKQKCKLASFNLGHPVYFAVLNLDDGIFSAQHTVESQFLFRNADKTCQ